MLHLEGLLEQNLTAFFAKEVVADDFDGVGKVEGEMLLADDEWMGADGLDTVGHRVVRHMDNRGGGTIAQGSGVKQAFHVLGIDHAVLVNDMVVVGYV